MDMPNFLEVPGAGLIAKRDMSNLVDDQHGGGELKLWDAYAYTKA